MRIIWTEFAKNELHNIFDYHRQEASLKVARKITTAIVESTSKLKDFPKTGPLEPYLVHRP